MGLGASLEPTPVDGDVEATLFGRYAGPALLDREAISVGRSGPSTAPIAPIDAARIMACWPRDHLDHQRESPRALDDPGKHVLLRRFELPNKADDIVRNDPALHQVQCWRGV